MYPDNDDWGINAPWLDDDSDIEPDYDTDFEEHRQRLLEEEEEQLLNQKTNDTTTEIHQQD